MVVGLDLRLVLYKIQYFLENLQKCFVLNLCNMCKFNEAVVASRVQILQYL